MEAKIKLEIAMADDFDGCMDTQENLFFLIEVNGKTLKTGYSWGSELLVAINTIMDNEYSGIM